MTDVGWVLYVKFATTNYRALAWTELWAAFVDRYPGKWAVQCFPPAAEVVDEQNIYHLFVLEEEPTGLNVRRHG